MSKTIVDTYKELAQDDYDTWATTGEGKNKIKKTGANGTETTLDAAENRAMYKLYLDEIKAQKAKDTALDTIAENRATVMRDNAVLTERAKEYAEKRAALSGMSKTGASQTAMIDLYSQMAGARADAQASFADQEKGVIQEYMNAINQANDTANATFDNAAISRAQEKESAEENLRNVASNYTTKIELDEAIKAFERKYGEGSAPSDVMDAYNSGDASPGQVKSWIEIATSEDYTDEGIVIDAYDANGKLFTKNQEDDSSSTFDLDDFKNKYENKVLRMVAGGAIKNGDVIRDTTHSNANYVYLDGKFYKITDDAVEKFSGREWDVYELGDDFLDLDEGNNASGKQSGSKKDQSKQSKPKSKEEIKAQSQKIAKRNGKNLTDIEFEILYKKYGAERIETALETALNLVEDN